MKKKVRNTSTKNIGIVISQILKIKLITDEITIAQMINGKNETVLVPYSEQLLMRSINLNNYQDCLIQ